MNMFEEIEMIKKELPKANTISHEFKKMKLKGIEKSITIKIRNRKS